MATDVSVPNNFTVGTPAVADDVDANFAAVVTWINTNAVHLDASKAFTSVPSGPATDPTSDNQLTRKAFVDLQISKGTSFPGSPVTGQLFTVTSTRRIWQYSGSAWVLVGGPAPYARVRRTATFSVSNVTNTVVSWDAETSDADAFHSTSVNPSRITVPATMGGLYSIGYYMDVAASGSGQTAAWVTINGGTDRYCYIQGYGSGAANILNASDFLVLAAGDYIEAYVYHNTGGSVAAVGSSSSFHLHRVGPA